MSVSLSDVGSSLAAPAWLIEHEFEERRLGTLKSGKEAEVFLVERVSTRGRCLLAHKRYRPREPGQGELRELGFSKGTIYRSDAVYRSGWNLKARDRRAVAKHTAHGREVTAAIWPLNELAMLRLAWRAGAPVPYPIGLQDDGVLMEFIGDEEQAAPRLVDARLDGAGLADAWRQLHQGLARLVQAHVVHADLSVYNLLWWQGRLVIIDFPQAVDVRTNPDAFTLLERDLANVAEWFGRRGVVIDVPRLYGELVASAF